MKENVFLRIWRFYYEGFRSMTIGKPLWLIVIVKLLKSVLPVLMILLTGLLIQALAGPFPVDALAFPVNSALLFASIAGLWVLYREKPDGAVCRWLSSGKTSIALLAAFLGCCLLLGLTRQDGEAGRFPGLRDICHTWWFILLALTLMANLFIVILSRRRKGARFLLNHIGVLVALAGCFFGAPDHQVYRTIVTKEPVREAVEADGAITGLPSALALDGFEVELDPKGNVRNYISHLDVDGKKVVLKVNHPYRLSFSEDLYLTGYDRENERPQHCIVEIVRQPWKYLIHIGILMMMAGSVLMFARGAAGKREERQ